MPILTDADLGARPRLLLVLTENPADLEPPLLLPNQRWPSRPLNFSERYAAYLDSVSSPHVSQETFLNFIRSSLQRREFVLATNSEPALALFADADRERLWNRLFTEVIDVFGLMALVIRTDSPLAPNRPTVERFNHCVRGSLGGLISDHQLLHSIDGE